jgi:lysophospholipase L1-like esterase
MDPFSYRTRARARDQLVPALPEVALYGDSRMAQNHYNLTNNLTYSATGLGAWAERFGKGQYAVPADLNFGVTGDTSAQMLARLPAVLASRAQCVVLMAPTNDRNTSENQTFAYSRDNFATMISRLTQAGKRVVVLTDTPRGNATYPAYLLTAAQLGINQQFRRWLLDVVAKWRGVSIVDLYPLMADPLQTDGRQSVANAYDGVHLAPIGAATAGYALALVLRRLFPDPFYVLDRGNDGLYSAANNPRGNLLPNPTWLGNSGGTKDAVATGEMPASSTLTLDAAFKSGTLTVAIAKAARAGYPDWLTLTLGGNAGATANQNLEVYQAASNANFAEGDVVQGMMEVELDCTGVWLATARATKTVNAASESSTALDGRDTANPMPTGLTGDKALFMLTRPFTWGAGATTSARLRFALQTIPGAAVAGTVKLGPARLAKLAA